MFGDIFGFGSKTPVDPAQQNTSSQRKSAGSGWFPSLGLPFSVFFGSGSKVDTNRGERATSPSTSSWSIRSYFFNTVHFGERSVPKSGRWSVSSQADQTTLTSSLETLRKKPNVATYNADQARTRKVNPTKATTLDSAIEEIARSTAPSHTKALTENLQGLCHQGFLGSFISNTSKLSCFSGATYFAKGNYDLTFTFEKKIPNQIVITATGEASPQLGSLDQRGLRTPLSSTSEEISGTITFVAIATVDPASGTITKLDFNTARGSWNITSPQKKGWLW